MALGESRPYKPLLVAVLNPALQRLDVSINTQWPALVVRNMRQSPYEVAVASGGLLADALDARHAGVGVSMFNAVAAAIGGFLGPFVVGAFVQRMGTFVSSMVAMGAFLCWAGIMMIALGIYTRVRERRNKKNPVARDGSDAVTSFTDLLANGDDKDAAAATDIELAPLPRAISRSKM
jgi:hypothetical protein